MQCSGSGSALPILASACWPCYRQRVNRSMRWHAMAVSMAVLCQELDKEDGQLVNVAAQIFQVYLDWTETQIRLLGKDEQEAKDLAIDLISSLQGTYVLTAIFRSPELLERKLQRLEMWIRTL